ncbi:MAG: hypothetical protein NUV59_04350 [Patescibacteria group bacterium]|nr:hypothetical protein [Patescibacteria group bacterium]
MKTPREIYAHYKILPALQLHQLRVAAVGKMVAEHFSGDLDAHTITLACLFHDMGNILKFDLTQFPEFLEPEGAKYWSGIKAEYAEKYGTDQHAATLAIARELALPDAVITCVDSVAFSKAEATLAEGSWEQKVCEYADSRVAPYGILSLDERLREARERYMKRKGEHDIALVPEERFEEIVAAERGIERMIFAQTSLKPEDITDESAAPLIKELLDYYIE